MLQSHVFKGPLHKDLVNVDVVLLCEGRERGVEFRHDADDRAQAQPLQERKVLS